MNQPDRYERFVLPADKKKVEYSRDTKLESAGTFTLLLEDHTLGNLVRMQLLSDPAVLFAGYRIPHPLEHRMLVRVQTTGVKAPHDAFQQALEALSTETEEMRAKFVSELNRVNQESAQRAAGHGY